MNQTSGIPALLPLLLTATLMAQGPATPASIKDAVLANWSRVEDYEVWMEMSIDLPGFRMPSRKVHYLYKAPDQVKVDVQGFAVVPREGIQPFTRFFTDSLDLQIDTTELVGGRELTVVSFQDTFQHKLAILRLWVDKERGTVPRGVVEFDGDEFFRTETRYVRVKEGIWLPEHSELHLRMPPDFKRMQGLGKMPVDMERLDREIEANPEWVTGQILLEFRKYKVNRGIPDHVFEEETEGYE